MCPPALLIEHVCRCMVVYWMMGYILCYFQSTMEELAVDENSEDQNYQL